MEGRCGSDRQWLTDAHGGPKDKLEVGCCGVQERHEFGREVRQMAQASQSLPGICVEF